MRNKWLLVAAALVMMALTWLDNDFSTLKTLSFGDLAPVILITGVVFLLKTGVLAAVLLVLKKVWKWIRKK